MRSIPIPRQLQQSVRRFQRALRRRGGFSPQKRILGHTTRAPPSKPSRWYRNATDASSMSLPSWIWYHRIRVRRSRCPPKRPLPHSPSPPSSRREEDSSLAAQAGRPVLKSCMAGPGSGAPGDSEPESQSDRRSRSLTHCHRDCPGQRASRDVGSLPCHRHGAHGRGRRASSLCDSKTITMERGIKLIIYLKAAALRRRRGRFKL